jgi:tetratricopeptide (TPR) repeat protein
MIRTVLMVVLATWIHGTPSFASSFANDSGEFFAPVVIASAKSTLAEIAMGPNQGAEDALDARVKYQQLVRSGVEMIKQGQYAEGIALLEPYRQNDDFLTLHALGVAYVRIGRNQEAYDILIRAHLLNPTVAAPLLPAALACARMARHCDDYRRLALEYKELGGALTRLADRIASYDPYRLAVTNPYQRY